MPDSAHASRFLLLTAFLPALLSAQSPQLRVQPTAKPGQNLATLLTGTPLQGFVTCIDTSGAAGFLLSEPLWLGGTPAFTLLDTGTLDGVGARSRTLTTPANPALVDQPIFFQSFVLESLAPNGLFRASNGESTVLHGHANAITFTFRDLIAEGISGDADFSVPGRVLAAPVRRRTATIEPAAGLPFPQPVATPLLNRGARLMHVFRAADLGARGVEEIVTAVRWKPFGPVTPDQYAVVAIELSHSNAVPDYAIDPFSALPKYPTSGLQWTFAANTKALETPVPVCSSSYAIRPSDVRPDGYLAWPQLAPNFVYDGFDSLLLDIRVRPGPSTLGANGFRTRLMVQSSSQPDTRIFSPSNGGPNIDPFVVTQAAQGDNTYYETQFEFTTVRSAFVTRYVPNPGPTRLLNDAFVLGDFPAGTSKVVEYEGAQDATGRNATGFATSYSIANGAPFLRLRVTLACEPISGTRPSVDTLVVPVD